jgi:hypothetical protein
MKHYVISRLVPGLVLSKPDLIYPKVRAYLTDYSFKGGTTNWGLVIIPDGIVLPQALLDDRQDNIVIPEQNINDPITTPQRNAINTELETTDLTTRVTTGQTIRDFFIALGTEWGHTEDFMLGID